MADKRIRRPGLRRINRKQFYKMGGLLRSDLCREHNGRHWTYWEIL